MARIVNVTETDATTSGTTYAVTLGSHATGEGLFCCVTQDSGTTTISFGNTTATLTAASDLVTYAGSDIFADGDQIVITTSGNLTGTGLVVNTRYWVRDIDTGANTFKLAGSSGGAAIDITGTGSGTHTFHLMADASTGWSMIGTQAAFADSRSAWAYKTATSGAESNPTFTGANDDWRGTCIVISEFDVAATIEWQRSDWGGSGAGIATGSSNAIAASSAGGTTVITAPEDALLLYSWSTDSLAYLRCKSDELICISKEIPTSATHVIGYRQHGASGNPADVTVYSTSLIEGGNGWVLAIPNATGGNLEKDCRSGITEVEWFGDFLASKGAICTISNGTPAVVTYTAPTTDQWIDGQGVSFSTTGALPTGITANTPYYITGLNSGANTFNLSLTLGGATINTSSAGSGVHTATPSFTAPNDVVATINSISTHTAIPTVSTHTPPKTPWGRMSSLINNTANVWGGGTWKIPATDMSGGIVALQWMVDVAPTAGVAGAEGAVVLFSDGTNWAVYQLATRALYLNSEVQQAFIDLDNGTPYASSGTLNTAAVTHVVPLMHRITTTSAGIHIKNLFVMRTATLTGGGEDFPLDFVTLYDAMNSWGSIDLASKQGSAQILGKAKIQIGDGTNKMYWDTSGAGFEFPVPYDDADFVAKNWNASTDSVSINIKAAAGNTVNLASGGITTSVPQAVTIDATSSASATYSVAGQSFKGLSGFTDNAGIALTGPTYKECGTVSLKASMTGMSVSKTVGAVPAVAMTANSKTLTSCTTDVTGTSATYHLETAVSVTAISLVDHTFTGTAATNKVHVLATTGTVIITISGTTVLDVGSVTSEGATVQVDAPVVTADISITGMPIAGTDIWLQIINTTALSAASRANSTAYSAGDIRLRQTGIGTEQTAGLYLRCTTSGTSAGTPPTWNTTVGGTTTDGTVVWTTYAVLYFHADPASATLTDTYIDGEEFLAGETVDIRFAEMNAGTSFKRYSTTVLAETTGFSALVTEEADDVYATNALDGSAYETTFSPDFTNDYIVLDTNTDFAGKAAYAYFCYTLTTDAGMWNFWGGVTALDVGNYRINTAILDLYFDESAGFVKQTDDVRIFRDDGTRPAIDPTTGGHGIEINWRTPVSVVLSGSGVTAQDKIDIANQTLFLEAVDGANSLAESIRLHNSVLGGKVSGAGTGTETFRSLADDKDRVVSTVDNDGNRTAIVKDLT